MQDWMIVLVIGAVVIFGASKLPTIARNMGKAQGEFKKGLKEGVVEDENASAATPAVPPAAAPPAATPPAAAAPEQPASDGDQQTS
jgi:sec-independent protein translocase protein TatA